LAVKFCPNCGNIMRIEIVDDVAYMLCSRCGYKEKYSGEVLSEKIKGESRVVVLGEKEKNLQILPTTKVMCPNCGYERAYYWEAQTRSGDEGTTQFFKCMKCGYTWRLYT